MQRLFSIFFLFVLCGFFSACHVSPKKSYVYAAPHSVSDKKCIVRCLYARKNCLRICDLKNSRYCDCTTSFNTCYSACGGQVIQR